jgi:PAS domain S-box-containing protein
LKVSQRNFVLLGDEESRQACEHFSKLSEKQINDIAALIEDNPNQVARVAVLRKAVAEMLSKVRDSIKVRQTDGFESAKQMLADDITGSDNARVDAIAVEMTSSEKRLLSQRLATLNTATEQTQQYIDIVNELFFISILLTVWLYSRSREKIQKSLALQHTISRLLNEAEDLYQAINKIEELVATHGDWPCVMTWLVDENENALDCFDFYSEQWLQNSAFIEQKKMRRFSKGEGLPGRVWAKQAGVTIEDLAKDDNFPISEAAKESGLKSAFAFPIVSNKNFFGVVEVFSSQKQTLDRDALDTFESIGREIGKLIERQRSQMRFRAIFNQTYGFIGFLDTEGNLLDVNDAALRFANVEMADVIHRPFWEGPWWTHDAKQQELLRSAIRKAASGEFCRFEASHVAADGSMAYVDFSLKPVSDTDGQVKYLIPEGRDITEKKEAQTKFRAVFDQTYGFIGLLRPDGIVLDYNESALEFSAAKREDVLGKPLWGTPMWSHDASLQQTVRQAVLKAANGEFVRFETRNPSSSGEMFDFDISIKPVLDQSGKVTMLIPEARNITAAKEAERRVSEFYSTVSHELRTPLTSIRGSLGLMEGGLTGVLPEKTLKMVKIARSECDRLIRLINDILDLQKIEAGMIELKRADVDTERIVERAVEGLRGMASTLNISISAENHSKGVVHCDQDRIIQVLTNLMSNALKFSPPGSEVTVIVEKGPEETFKFSVKDNGPGIPAEQSHKLFARFQQLDQSDSRAKGGTGLGLAITKAIIEEHGGQIGVDSIFGEGSTFWFCLPEAASKNQQLTKTAHHREDRLPPSHIHPALIVEDDDSIASILKEHLEQDGFQAVRASTLEEAHHLMNRYTPLVMLLDLTLPDGDGLDFLTKLSLDEKRNRTPVVIVTGKDSNGDIKCGYPALIDWIEKPIDESKLHEALDAARKHFGPARVLIVEDDIAAREILSQQLNSLGVKCLEAKDGAEAIKAFRDSNPDLIILDLSIPSPDGFAVVDVLKDEPNGHKPLIVYTAMDLNNEQKHLLKLGLTAHLTKSLNSVEEVIGTVKEFLDGMVPRSR